ncbi:XRE family transcriptional regulator [Anaerotruncus sp. AF02-27]|nr:XRE family transcriptional regulator [Anaerotruncus sp. AF02-27]
MTDKHPKRKRMVKVNYLKKLRGQRPQRELARTLKIRVPDYSRYETGKANPTPEQMKDLCEYHRCNVGTLYDREDWDYDLIDPVKPRETRRSGKGTGILKFSVRLTEGLANRIQEQCRTSGMTQAQYLKRCADLMDKELISHEALRPLQE